jgi:hypothetical protein
MQDSVLHEEPGNLDDISPSVCRLLMEQAITKSTPVEIRCVEHLFHGSVRYCHRIEIGFAIGVQFTEAGAWKREEFEPKQLFDVRCLNPEPDKD